MLNTQGSVIGVLSAPTPVETTYYTTLKGGRPLTLHQPLTSFLREEASLTTHHLCQRWTTTNHSPSCTEREHHGPLTILHRKGLSWTTHYLPQKRTIMDHSPSSTEKDYHGPLTIFHRKGLSWTTHHLPQRGSPEGLDWQPPHCPLACVSTTAPSPTPAAVVFYKQGTHSGLSTKLITIFYNQGKHCSLPSKL